MKSSTIPPLRVDPSLRQAAEGVLQPGESLSSFVEQSIRLGIRQRQTQNEFIKRGLASRSDAKKTNEYYSAAQIFDELAEMLIAAETAVKSKQKK